MVSSEAQSRKPSRLASGNGADSDNLIRSTPLRQLRHGAVAQASLHCAPQIAETAGRVTESVRCEVIEM